MSPVPGKDFRKDFWLHYYILIGSLLFTQNPQLHAFCLLDCRRRSPLGQSAFMQIHIHTGVQKYIQLAHYCFLESQNELYGEFIKLPIYNADIFYDISWS